MSRKRTKPRYLLSRTNLIELLQICDKYREKKGYINYKSPSVREFLKYRKPVEEENKLQIDI